jgi:hypothetical protein
MLDYLGTLRVDALGKITDDPEAIRIIDDPGLQVALLGIRQRIRWIEEEERPTNPALDPGKVFAWLWSANNFYAEIVYAIERVQNRRAGSAPRASAEAVKAAIEAMIPELISLGSRRRDWASFIQRRLLRLDQPIKLSRRQINNILGKLGHPAKEKRK